MPSITHLLLLLLFLATLPPTLPTPTSSFWDAVVPLSTTDHNDPHVSRHLASCDSNSKSCTTNYVHSRCRHWCDEEDCPGGYIWDDDWSYCSGLACHWKCFPCAPGYYDTRTNVGCLQCGFGKSSSAGSMVCTDCPAGEYKTDKLCQSCGDGFWSDGGAERCSGTDDYSPGGSDAPSKQMINGLMFPDQKHYTLTVHTAAQRVLIPHDTAVACADQDGIKTAVPTADLDDNDCVEGAGKNPDKSCKLRNYCFKCPAGYIADDGKAGCTKCGAGMTSNERMDSCVICPPGTAKFHNKVDCEDCEAGKYAIGGNIRCDSCAMGQYSVAAAANCLDCDAGSYARSMATAVCDFCDAGKKSQSGEWECEYCDPGESSQGTYEPAGDPTGTQTAGPITCIPCLAGKRAEEGLCTDCNAGKYSNEGAALCTLCVTPGADYGPGHMSGPASPDCTACVPGKYLTDNVCTDCVPGKSTDLKEAQEECMPCVPGSTSIAAQPECTDCAANTFNNENGLTPEDTSPFNECKACPGGSFSGEGDIICRSCASGKVQNLDADGNLLVVDGSADATCYDCAAGKQQDSLVCVDCEKGESAVSAGSSSCSKCSIGSEAFGGATACTPCGNGNYTSVPGRNCKPCEAGTKTEKGTTGSEYCIDCLPGQLSARGAAVCTDCAVGKYSTNPTLECTDCYPGKYAADTGNAGCTPCTSGNYQNAAGATRCIECKAGKYQTLPMATACGDCTAGKYSAENGTTFCSSCNVPTQTDGEVSGRRATGCTPCPAGTESGNRLSPSVCMPCGGGKFSGEGARSCEDCASGSFSEHPASTVEVITLSPTSAPSSAPSHAPSYTSSAPTGQRIYSYSYTSAPTDSPTSAPTATPTTSAPTIYESSAPTIWDPTPDVVGATSCTLCVAGKYSRGGNSECGPCPAGRYSDAGAKAASAIGSTDSDNVCKKCTPGKYSQSSFGGSCSDCPNTPPGSQVYTHYSEEEDSTCFELATAEQMQTCPRSTRAGIENVCKWFFFDEFAGSNSLLSENEGAVSPFGNGCANYTLCSADPSGSDNPLDPRHNKVVYHAMCSDCEDGYESAGSVTGTFGECNGGSFQKYCYKPAELDVCPDGQECEYAYMNDKVDVPTTNYPRSPFFPADDPDEMLSMCAEYKICGFDGGKILIGCLKCQAGWVGLNEMDEDYGDSCPNTGMNNLRMPNVCFDVTTELNKCPDKPLGELLNGNRRLGGEEEAQDAQDAQIGGLRGHRKLPDWICGTCSCSASSSTNPCAISNKCEDDDSDCDSSLCVCTGDNGGGEDGGGGGDDGSSLVDCEYLISEWDDDSEDVPGSVLWETNFEEVDSGENSLFVTGNMDSCESYQLCDLEMTTVPGFGTSKDNYYIACSKCKTNEGFFPAIDSSFNDYRGDCTKGMNLPTYCYKMTEASYTNHDFRECRDITKYQKEKCFYWHDNDFQVRSTTPRFESPYYEGCSEYDLCESGVSRGFDGQGNAYEDTLLFDPFDGVEDHFYLTCKRCLTGWVPVYGDLTDAAQAKGCKQTAFTSASNKVIVGCTRPTTSSPTIAPTSAPTSSAPTSSPTQTSIQDKAKEKAKEALSNPKVLGGTVVAVVLLLGGAAMLVKKSRDKKKRRSSSEWSEEDRDDSDSEDREGSWDPRGGNTVTRQDSEEGGFEMQNPMKSQVRKGAKGGAGAPPPPPPEPESKAGNSAPPPPPPAPVAVEVPVEVKKKEKPEWAAKQDPNSGQTFYYNRKTKAVSWTPPPEMMGDKAGNAPPPPPQMPAKQFEAHVDPGSGATYYINFQTGESQWEAPPPGTY